MKHNKIEFSSYLFILYFLLFANPLAAQSIVYFENNVLIIKDNYRKNISELNKKCANNEYEKCYLLGKEYFWEENREQDKYKGIELLEKTCLKGHLKSCSYLLSIYAGFFSEPDTKNHDKALNMYQNLKEKYFKKCKKNDAESCYSLAYMYDWYDHLVKKDNEKTIDLFRKSCNLGYADGCYNMGYFYSEGKNGLKKDENKSILFYNKACNNNSSIACKQLAKLYYNRRDKKKAIKLFQKSCKGGNFSACDTLIKIYKQQGKYLKVDNIYLETCKQGHRLNCYHVAAQKRLEDDLKSKLLSLYYFKKSCELGYNFGCISLKDDFKELKQKSKYKIKAVKYTKDKCLNDENFSCQVLKSLY